MKGEFTINIHSNENIEQIAAIIIHELKSPLALINANIDYLELCDEDNKFFRNYSAVKSEVEKATRMLNDFISVLNGSSNSLEQISVSSIIMEITKSYIEAHSNEVNFTFDFEADKDVSSTADKMAYTIVFSNTIKNAVESIEAQGRKDTGEIKIISEAIQSKIIFKVIDNGKGLSESEINKIKNDESFTTKKAGSGFGVSICKKIMNELGGSYDLSNNEFGIGCAAEIAVTS